MEGEAPDSSRDDYIYHRFISSAGEEGGEGEMFVGICAAVYLHCANAH